MTKPPTGAAWQCSRILPAAFSASYVARRNRTRQFGRRDCRDRQCVYFGTHHIIQAIIHQAMTGYPATTLESRCNQTQAEMAATRCSTGMTGMQR